jgi:hypothetical protein
MGDGAMELAFYQAPQKSGQGERGMSIPGNSLSPPGQRRSRNAPGCYRPIDIDRSPDCRNAPQPPGGSPRALKFSGIL